MKQYRLGLAAGVLGLLALGGCGSKDQPPAQALEQREDLIRLACGLNGHDVKADKCWLEWLPGAAGEGRDFLIHHADGGFRRFALSADGNKVDIADGALPFVLTHPVGEMVSFTVGDDAYEVPTAVLRKPR